MKKRSMPSTGWQKKKKMQMFHFKSRVVQPSWHLMVGLNSSGEDLRLFVCYKKRVCNLDSVLFFTNKVPLKKKKTIKQREPKTQPCGTPHT